MKKKKWSIGNGKAIWGRLSMLVFVVLATLNNAVFAFAETGKGGSTDYAKNAGEWLSDQLFWIGLIVLIIALVMMLAKRNYVGCIITLLGGGIILYFIKNPEKIGEIGETIAKLIFK